MVAEPSSPLVARIEESTRLPREQMLKLLGRRVHRDRRAGVAALAARPRPAGRSGAGRPSLSRLARGRTPLLLDRAGALDEPGMLCASRPAIRARRPARSSGMPR